MADQHTENNIFEFIKYILSDMVTKLTIVTSNMTDVTNQVKNLTTVVSQPPTRSDILEKINITREAISNEIDDEIVKRLNDREKDYFNLNIFIKELNVVVQKLTTMIDENTNLLNKLHNKINILQIVVAAIFALIPILWGLFEIVNKINVNK